MKSKKLLVPFAVSVLALTLVGCSDKDKDLESELLTMDEIGEKLSASSSSFYEEWQVIGSDVDFDDVTTWGEFTEDAIAITSELDSDIEMMEGIYVPTDTKNAKEIQQFLDDSVETLYAYKEVVIDVATAFENSTPEDLEPYGDAKIKSTATLENLDETLIQKLEDLRELVGEK